MSSPNQSPPNSPNPNNNQGGNVNGNINGNIQYLANVQISTSNVSINGNATTIVSNLNTNVDVASFIGNTYIPSANITLNQTVSGVGYVVTNTQGDGITHTTFDTTDPTFDPQITENLVERVETYYNDDANTETKNLMDEIKLYAGRIQCEDFHGKGTIDDYNELFIAAAKIANESKQIKLDIDVAGFEDFSQAADDLANLFQSFIIKLENVNIINDLDFLRSIVVALRKIWNLSEVFGKFKQTILAKTSVQVPKSAHDASVILGNVMGEINCAMKYISHFVAPSTTTPAPVGANLSADEQNVINQAVNTIENWNVLCDQGVSIAMSNNPDIIRISSVNSQLREKAPFIRTATALLRAKLANFTINT